MKKIMALLVVALLLLPTIALADDGGALPIDLTPLFQALIGVLATIITVKVIPWIKARLTAEQQAIMDGLTRTAVYAAEQLYASGAGKDKMNYVVNYLAKHGYKVDRAAIEAAVRELTIAQESGVVFKGVEVKKPPDVGA